MFKDIKEEIFMSIERVRNYFEELGMGDKVHEFAQTTATVEEAAIALGCAPELIAKTMSFIQDEKPMIIVTAGDAKIDNKKYKAQFQQKAKMIPREQVEELIGHAPGGVCPFAIDQAIPVYLDVSLQRFETVYPAAGNSQSAVELSIEELVQTSHSLGWIDVCVLRE